MKQQKTFADKILEILLSFAVLGMAAILIAGVIARTIFNSSLSFTEEVGQMLNIAVTFLGIGYCAKQARHISMSVIYDFTNVKVKKILTCLISLGTSLVMFYLTYLAVYYVHLVYELERVSAALRVPMWLFYLSVPLGFLMAGVEYLKTFVKNVREKDEIYISSILKLGENMDEDISDETEEVSE